jgi:hypothetical protein
MPGRYDEHHAQMMRVLARRHPCTPPIDAGNADRRTYEREERHLVGLLRAAVRERFGTSRAFAAGYEALRRSCGKSRGADEGFEAAASMAVDQAVGAVLEEVLTGRAYEITAAYLDQHLRNALLGHERQGRKERPLPEQFVGPAARNVPETLDQEARQQEEHRRLNELLRRQQGSPALNALLRLWGDETTHGPAARLVDHLLPAEGVPDFLERLEGLLADFDDLRRDAEVFPRQGAGARRAGLLLDAWLGEWPVYHGGKMKFYQEYCGRHGVTAASSVSNWLTGLRDLVCTRLDLRLRDAQGFLTRVNDHELAEALVAIAHHLDARRTAPSPDPGDGLHGSSC